MPRVEYLDYTKSKSVESYITLLVCALISFSVIKSALLIFLRSIIGSSQKIDVVIMYFILFIIIILSFQKIFSRTKIDAYWLFLFLFLYWVFALVFHGEYIEMIKNIGINLFIISFSSYVLARSIRDYSLLLHYLQKTSILGILALVVLLIFGKEAETIEQNYSQWIGYSALVMTIIIADLLFSRFSMYYLIITGTGLFLIISAGSRGPLICFSLYLVIKMIYIFASGQRKKVILSSIILILLIIGLGEEKSVVVLQKMISSQRLSNRVVQQISDKTIFEDSARVQLRAYSFDIISAHPIIGVGIINDRVMLAEKMGTSPEEARGWYPHNIAIEFLVQYGTILAVFLLSGIGILFIRAVKVSTDNDFKNTILIFFSVGVLPLLFSGSYLESPLFFAFLGFCMNSISISKNMNYSH